MEKLKRLQKNRDTIKNEYYLLQMYFLNENDERLQKIFRMDAHEKLIDFKFAGWLIKQYLSGATNIL